MNWQEVLMALPDDASQRAARARRRALAEMERQGPGVWGRGPAWWWASVAAGCIAALVLGFVWLRQATRVETLAWQPPAPVIAPAPLVAATPQPPARPVRRRPPEPDRLQVQLALSDGTRVYWTLDRNFSLRGTL